MRAPFAPIAALILVFLTALPAFAEKGGANAGGGGLGLKVGAGTYVLDLVVVDAFENPYFKTAAPDAGLSLGLKSAQLPDWMPLASLSRKLKDAETIDPVFASAIFETVVKLTWHKTSLELTPTEDRDGIPVQGEILQLARRDAAVVRIQEQLWNALDEANRTALIIHEAVAALAGSDVSSEQVREVVGQLFTQEFYRRDRPFILQTLTGFPSIQVLKNMLLPVNFTRTAIANYSATYPSDPKTIQFFEQSEYYFTPHLRINWDGFAPRSEMDDMFLIPEILATPYTHFCEGPNAGRVRSAVAEYYAVTVILPPPDKDGQVPHVLWKLDSRMQKMIPGCSEYNTPVELQILRDWAKTVQTFN